MKANSRRQIVLTLCVVTASYFGILNAQDRGLPSELNTVDPYILGLQTEEVEMDYLKAARFYQTVIEDFDLRRQKAANAVFRLGECLRKLGRFEASTVQYARILREFPDQVELTRLSHQFVAQTLSIKPGPGRVPTLMDISGLPSSPRGVEGGLRSVADVSAQDRRISDLNLLSRQTSKAKVIQCVRNLMQIGLARRIYATENNDQFPEDWKSLKKYLGGSPVLMVCPSDKSHLNPSSNWEDFDFKNTSYEYISPGGGIEVDLSTVVFYCTVHRNIALADGSVQQKHSGTERLLKSALEQNAKN